AKKGRSTLLYDNNKFRESYVLKSGESDHFHPSPPLSRRRPAAVSPALASTSPSARAHVVSPSAAAVSPALAAASPSPAAVSLKPTTTSPAFAAIPTSQELSLTPLALSSTCPSDSQTTLASSTLSPSSHIQDLEAENNILREEVSKLKDRITITTRCSPPAAPSTMDIAPQDHLEVMEAEIKCLKDEAKIYKERHEGSSHEWKVQINKKHRPRQVNNKNKCFSQQDPEYKKVTKNNSNTSKNNLKTPNAITKETAKNKHTENKHKTKNFKKQQNLPPIIFQNVHIESDSHDRHIAGLLQGIIGPSPKVTAVVKPGAKFLSVTSDTLPPPHTCTIIIAGTNDVAAGEHTSLLNIYGIVQQSTYLEVPLLGYFTS
ncbi:hypothetical protein J6590_106712, partial [Homalodisca vitripennis]